MDLDESLRDALVVDRGGYPYVIHPLMDGVPRVDPRLLIRFAEWACDQDVLQGATVLLAPEAMAIPLAAALSLKTGIPYLVVRKRRYDLEGETMAYCETGYGQNRLYINGLRSGDRVLVVEDVISTGGTVDGILTTLGSMDVVVRGVLSFVDKGGQSQEIAARHGVPVRVMRRLRLGTGHVEVEE